MLITDIIVITINKIISAKFKDKMQLESCFETCNIVDKICSDYELCINMTMYSSLSPWSSSRTILDNLDSSSDGSVQRCLGASYGRIRSGRFVLEISTLVSGERTFTHASAPMIAAFIASKPAWT